jgi:predicted secreted protein
MAGEKGYNGRELRIVRAGIVLAQVQTKSVPHIREPVDVTTDDDDGWRRLLDFPGRRAIDVTVEGVTTINNRQFLEDDWLGNVMTDIEIHHPDGTVEVAQDGFFLSALEFSGEEDGHVPFTATYQSSGAIDVIEGT